MQLIGRKLIGALLVAAFAVLAVPTVSFAYTVSGNKFVDNDADGVDDGNSDPGLNGLRIYADLNDNDAFDDGEPSFVTAGPPGPAGNYSFTVANNSDYTIREVLPAGYTCSIGTIGDFSTCEKEVGGPTQTANVTGVNFGNFQPVSISGLKFDDLDGDGVQDLPDEQPIGGVRIYLDGSGGQPANNQFDEGETFETTEADGTYSFTNLRPGSYSVREEPPTETVCTSPGGTDASCEYNLTLGSGANSTGRNFGNAAPATVSGTKFEDLNANGVQDEDEGPLDGVTIYVDANNNDALNAGEPSTLTDVNGGWTLSNVPPGTRTIREVEPSGYSCTAPSATFADCEFEVALTAGSTDDEGQDFGNAPLPKIAGTKFEDLNANGVKEEGEPPLGDVTIYLDLNGNDVRDTGPGGDPSTTTDAQGNWSLTVEPGGPYTVREVPPSGYECSAPSATFADCEFTETDLQLGDVRDEHDFGNFKRVAISGRKFEDVNADGTKQGPEPVLSGVQIYLDGTGGQSANDQFDDGETTTTTDGDGRYSFTGLLPGSYTVREVLQEPYRCATPGAVGDFSTCEYNLTLTSGTNSTNNDFGNFRPATLSGTKFDDQNANGLKDAGEPPIADVTIYLDANGNNAFDGGESSDTTDASGDWSVTGLVPGSHTVREVEPTGYLCSAPSPDFANCEFTETLTSAETDATGQNFGNTQAATVSGTKFEDLDASGSRDASEGPLAGVTIYSDVNANDTLDAGEPSTSTAADGTWSLTGLFPRAHTIRELQPSGYECTAPSATFADCEFLVTLTPGSTDAGHEFGNHSTATGGEGRDGGGAGAGTCLGRPVTIAGSGAGDHIVGTPGADVIATRAGADTVKGRGGNDRICGQKGKDRLVGGAGKDRLSGGGGKDKLLGKKGKDRLVGGAGKDRLSGGGGKDKLLGRGGKDRLRGGSGTDVCNGGKKNDRASGCEIEKST